MKLKSDIKLVGCQCLQNRVKHSPFSFSSLLLVLFLAEFLLIGRNLAKIRTKSSKVIRSFSNTVSQPPICSKPSNFLFKSKVNFKICLLLISQKTNITYYMLNWSKPEMARLMITKSSNWMISLAGSGFKTEEDHLNILIVDSSVCYNVSPLPICGNVWFDTNLLKMHPNGVPTVKKYIEIHIILYTKYTN